MRLPIMYNWREHMLTATDCFVSAKQITCLLQIGIQRREWLVQTENMVGNYEYLPTSCVCNTSKRVVKTQ